MPNIANVCFKIIIKKTMWLCIWTYILTCQKITTLYQVRSSCCLAKCSNLMRQWLQKCWEDFWWDIEPPGLICCPQFPDMYRIWGVNTPLHFTIQTWWLCYSSDVSRMFVKLILGKLGQLITWGFIPFFWVHAVNEWAKMVMKQCKITFTSQWHTSAKQQP